MLLPVSNRRILFFCGLLAIIIIYSLYNLVFLNRAFYYSVPRGMRHVVKLGAIAFVYVVGLLVFRRGAPRWLLSIWHLAYAAATLLLLSIGAYDGLLHTVSYPVRGFADTVEECLVSPAPYVVLWLVCRSRYGGAEGI
jgi:hypothetical protein